MVENLLISGGNGRYHRWIFRHGNGRTVVVITVNVLLACGIYGS